MDVSTDKRERLANEYSYDDELYHFGVKGMKWGVRRQARKDAKEYFQAKMYYGEGAGTRRKLIKAKVAQSSKDPNYKKEFDSALSKRDVRKDADKAVAHRHRKDAANTTAKTARGIKNVLFGHPELASTLVLVLATAARIVHIYGADKWLAANGKIAYSVAKKAVKDIAFQRMLKQHGF